MLENATFPLPYFSTPDLLHFSELRVHFQNGFAVVSGKRNPQHPVRASTLSLEKCLEKYTDDPAFPWIIENVDVSNPLLDAELCEFWKTSALPYAVKNAVEEIAYQHRRIVSAESSWAQCENDAQRKGVHPFSKPLTLRQYAQQKTG